MLSDIDTVKDSAWISYGFIHFAYLMLLLTPFFIRRGSADYIYRRSTYAVTATWFLVQLVVGVTIILMAPDTVKVTILIQVILAALFLGCLLIFLIANERTANSVKRREAELRYVKVSSSKLQSILQKITDRATAKKVERVYDLIHSSQVKSDDSVRTLEREIISEINNLDSIAERNNLEQITTLADKIYKLADKRNRQLKDFHA